MNSTTFHFSGTVALALATFGCCLALGYAAFNTRHLPRLRHACGLAWVCLAALSIILVALFKARYPSLETAPRPVQWQLGATLAAGALMARVTLLRLAELGTARACGEQAQAARLERGIRLQLVAAAVLLGFAAVAGG